MGRDDLDLAPKNYVQTEGGSRTPPPNIPINGIRTPPPTIERITALLPPFMSSPEQHSQVDAQPSTLIVSPGLGDMIGMIGVKEHSAESRDVIVEGPSLSLDPSIALLNYY